MKPIFKILFVVLFLTFGLEQTNSQPKQGQTTDKATDKEVHITNTILILGDSLSEGFGVDAEKAYPALLQEQITSSGLNYEVLNRSRSGDTTAGGISRITTLLPNQEVNILVVALGANDGLRGLSPEATKANIEKIISLQLKKYPKSKVIVAGMRTPPSMGALYATKFDAIFKAVATEQKVLLLPFLLEGVAGEPEMNIADGIHPNEEGHQRIAKNVWKVIQPLLEQH